MPGCPLYLIIIRQVAPCVSIMPWLLIWESRDFRTAATALLSDPAHMYNNIDKVILIYCIWLLKRVYAMQLIRC